MAFYTDQELYSIIGKNIKRYRIKANLTQLQLSEEAKISLSYITKIEAPSCDKSISLSTLNQISKALNIEIERFFKE